MYKELVQLIRELVVLCIYLHPDLLIKARNVIQTQMASQAHVVIGELLHVVLAEAVLQNGNTLLSLPLGDPIAHN
jgi:hypothetical protein